MERVHANPIIPGFAPDPSVVFVDGTYFLVNSTFHTFPGLPIYASKDLVTWTHIGNAIIRAGQLNLQQPFTKLHGPDVAEELMAAQGGLYAPSIRYHKVTFYIVCTNVLHKPELPYLENEFQNFILTTGDIWANEWSDPIFYDFFGIDTSLFWDDDDRAYLIGSASPAPETKIRQFEIDLKTGKKLSEEKLLWEGITKVFPKGPHMYKKDGWYYLLIAEGGCFADHHTIMARSKSIWGPFEVNPNNPVMGKTDPNGYIQYTGHGDLFQDPSGQWYFICLGVRKTKEGRFIMGRETVITTAQWPEGEFPTIDFAKLDVPIKGSKQPVPAWPLKPNSTSLIPEVELMHIRNPVKENYKYDGSRTTLITSKAQLSQADEPVSFVGKRQRLLDGTASVTLNVADTSALENTLEAGLCYYKDELRFARTFLDVHNQEIVWEIKNKVRSIDRRATKSAEALLAAASAKVVFGISHTENQLSFWYSADGVKEELGQIDSLDMTGHDFVGPVIGAFGIAAKETRVEFAGLVV
ncbi:hypothetical protein CEP54_009246 [Fusarium duplospermum]|uniref:Beta-xylosidase C-terminal Concanavalin A-like domain-containing protein n=1 Tax=Fusarium duplospermum TaxID=1325734 RepID=A0A428PRG4_9HYPO|nr:hypothetical protein CEP54_009246 [Fusarium duplospermum]